MTIIEYASLANLNVGYVLNFQSNVYQATPVSMNYKEENFRLSLDLLFILQTAFAVLILAHLLIRRYRLLEADSRVVHLLSRVYCSLVFPLSLGTLYLSLFSNPTNLPDSSLF